MDTEALAVLIAKDEIRELAMLYARGVDRKDPDLLRSLYTADATDTHGAFFDGPADAYVDALERAMPHMIYSGHHICNHLIAVDGDTADGEVYALAIHLIPDGAGGTLEDIECVRYVDRYARVAGRWRFASRIVAFDMVSKRPVPTPERGPDSPDADPSVTTLRHALFARGPRR